MLSRFGLGLAVVYVALAIFVVLQDRAPGSGGGWISLSGMATYLVTMPVSAPFELMGAKLDFRKNLDMAVAIGGCALLVYFIGAAAAWLVGSIVQGPRK